MRTGLSEAGIDFGVFGPAKKVESSATPKRQTQFSIPNNAKGHANEHENGNGVPEAEDAESDGEADDADPEQTRKSRPVIKLRPSRHRALSRSRSRRDLSQAAAEETRRPISPDAESVANVRFSAHIVAKADLMTLMPFALIAPEKSKRRRRSQSREGAATPVSRESEDPSAPGGDTVPPTPVSIQSTRGEFPFLQGPTEDLKGVFIRKFRWGTIDVLDPNHCDFSALRTAVLNTHLKVCYVV